MLLSKAIVIDFYTRMSSLFATKLEEVPRESDPLRTDVELDTTTWKSPFGGGFPSMQPWEDEKTFENIKAALYQLTPTPWTSGVEIDRHDLEDAKDVIAAVAGYEAMVEDEAISARRFYDERTFEALKNADATKGPDEQNFISTAHPYKKLDGSAGTQSNKLGTTGDKWWLADLRGGVLPIVYVDRQKPTPVNLLESIENFMRRKQFFSLEARAICGYGRYQKIVQHQGDIDATNFKAARKALRQMKGPLGNPLQLKATHLICGINQEDNARALLASNALLIENGKTNIEAGNVQILATSLLD